MIHVFHGSHGSADRFREMSQGLVTKAHLDGDKLVMGFVKSLPTPKQPRIFDFKVLPDHWIEIQFAGESGQAYTLNDSRNLRAWSELPAYLSTDAELPVAEIVGTGVLQSVFAKSAGASRYFQLESHGPPLDFGDAMFE